MKNFKIGLQLYSIREDVEKDMDAALKAVKEMGYDCVEFAGFFGKSAEEVRAMLDKYGLEAISVHQTAEPWLKEGQKAIDYLKTVGIKFCAIPWYPVEKLCNPEEFEKMVKEFTDFGKALKENGIQLLYHNHDFEFTNKIDGEYVFDCIYNSVPADLLRPEMDVCWIKYGGEDPCKYIEKYDGMKLLHLKDFTAKKMAGGPAYALIDDNGGEAKENTKEANGFEFKPVGYGVQDFKTILESAEKSGIECVIVEQDMHPEHSALEDAKLSIDYLKTLGL